MKHTFHIGLLSLFVIFSCQKPSVTPSPSPSPNPPAPAEIRVTGVSLNKASISLTEGNSYTLSATVLPDNATNKNVNWTSSDSSVASVDQSGKVSAVKAGSATITVTTSDGGKTATCAVSVVNNSVPVTGVSLNQTSISLTEGSSYMLSATVLPDNATNKNVNWTSSAPDIAFVDNNGVVTAKAPGSATITVSTTDGGKTAICVVTVNPFIHVTGISLDYYEIELELGKTFRLTATVTPDNATDKDVIWTSFISNTVSVDQNGLVSALAPGQGRIVAQTADGNFSAGCTVNVVSHIESITLNVSEIEMSVNQEYDLIATIKPDNATDEVVWTSSDNRIVSVSNGHLKATAQGKATITVMTKDEKVKASCEITVKGEGLDPTIGDWGEGGDYSGETN